VFDRLMPFAVSFATTCAFFINVCAWIFACGCRSVWAGADLACNIHRVEARHCPFCSHGIVGYAGVLLLVSIPQLAFSLTSFGRSTRVVLCLALFPAAMIAVGLLLGWYEGYWVMR
jgi:hypothetical protein